MGKTPAFGLSAFLMVIGVAMPGGTASAQAQSFAKAPGEAFSLDLDVAEGTFSYWHHGELGAFNAMHLKLAMLGVRDDPEWLPICTIRLSDAGPHNSLILQLVSPERQRMLNFALARRVGDKEVSLDPIEIAAAVGDRFDVLLSWSASGVAIRIDGQGLEPVPLTWRVDSVTLSGSTGECEFDPVEFGRLR